MSISDRAWATGPFSQSFHDATELIGKRWTGAVLYALSHGLGRFTDLREAIPGLSARMLAERLRELEDHGVVDRSVIASRPVAIEYRLTAKGDALRPVLVALNAWAYDWSDAPTAGRDSV